MPGPLLRSRRRLAWLWMIYGLFAVLCFWGGRRLARGIDGGGWRAIEEFGAGVAPLVLFALIWLLADSARPPNAQAGCRRCSG